MLHHALSSVLLAQRDVKIEGPGIVPLIIMFALVILMVASNWVIFTKAGKPGWACIIPFYNMWVLVEICKKSPVWFVLMFIPCVNIIVALLLQVELAKVFGKGVGYALGLIFLPVIFLPLLAFGDAQYQPGPAV
jgi:hypothetical protein